MSDERKAVWLARTQDEKGVSVMLEDEASRTATVLVEPVTFASGTRTANWYLAHYPDATLVAAPVTDPDCIEALGEWHAWPDGEMYDMAAHAYAGSLVMALATCREKQLARTAAAS